MRLLEYVERTRTKVITAERAKTMLNGDYSDSYKSKTIIYRGLDSNENFLYINAGSRLHEPRTSANTENYYTWIIDSSSRWDIFPKRSKSIICSTDKYSAATYGTLYQVYPRNNSEIGVCPSTDMWDSFKTNSNVFSLEDLNVHIDIIFKINGVLPRTIKTFNDMVDAFNIVDKKRISDIPTKYPSPTRVYDELSVDFYKQFLSSHKKLYYFLEDFLDPKKNNFTLKKAGDVIPDDREIWTSSPSVLVRVAKDGSVEHALAKA